MENKKGRGGKRENAGRPKKDKERFKFQIIAYAETIQAIKNLKIHCTENDLDFVDELNKRLIESLSFH